MRDLADLKERLRVFVAERDWQQFHSPKNLAMALSVEASELVELFQWLTEEESAAADEKLRRRAAEELADVLWFLPSMKPMMVPTGAPMTVPHAPPTRTFSASPLSIQ
jgi:NTP pyrophosphatase (non-canonical NTP hydrolase)